MRLHELVKIQRRPKKRVGRGVSSGKGKTSGRGTKGQKARGTIPVGFSGDSAFFKKLPRRRGMGNSPVSIKPKLINLSALNVFKSRTVIDIEELLRAKIISEEDSKKGVKILSTGEIDKALIVKLPVSKNARQKIESKGGKLINV